MNGRIARTLPFVIAVLCLGTAPPVTAQSNRFAPRLASTQPTSAPSPLSAAPLSPAPAPSASAPPLPPPPDTALLETGEQCLSSGDTTGAIKAFSSAAAEVPRSPAAYHQLALADLHAGQYDAAARAARAALDDCPPASSGHSENEVLLGRALYGDYRARLDAWNERFAALPGAAQLLKQMSRHQWEDPSGVILTEHTDVDAAPVFDGMRDGIITEMYAMRRVLAQAEDAYRDAIAANAGQPGAHDGLGLVLAAIDESTEARREITRELEIQGPSALVYQHLGELDIDDGDYASAIDDLRRSLVMNPRAIAVYDDLAKIYGRQHDDANKNWAKGMSLMFQGKTDEAGSLFDKAQPNCNVRRAQALLCVQRRQTDQARSYLNDALKSAPQDARTLAMLADVEVSQSHWDKAMAAYKGALESDPDNDSAWYGVGLVSDKLNKPADAMAAYAKALSLNADNSLARLNLAADEVDSGQKQAATGDLREYLKRFPIAPDRGDVRAMLEQVESSL